ncbi:MAG: glycogen/starch synthase [Paludibacteraceae bacterium]|nr:glycogen/starch synthase [Paludibacteraceae bacterium]MBR4840491.1 glycogen/starch synthase [Paludibacteraceae bacterium]
MEATKILYIAQEIVPYLPESEVASICRYMPQAIQEKGREIRTFMPKFGCVNERRNQLHEVIRLSGMNLIIDDTDHPLIIKVASIQAARMQVYFIDNDDFFQRRNTVSDENGEFEDNEDRSIFFVRGVLETVKKLRWTPDIVHCNGWMSALAPLYIKKAFNTDPFFKNSKLVYSLYNDAFQKPFSDRFGEKLKIEGVEDGDVTSILGKSVSFADLSKFAIEYSDGVVQASEQVDASVLEYVEKEGKLFLPYQPGDTSYDALNSFYDKVLEK